MRLTELLKVTKKMKELGIDPATTTVADIYKIVAIFKKS